MNYYIQVYGCAANVADSERIATGYTSRGWKKAKTIGKADEIVIVTCMIRQSAEDRIGGLIRNILKSHKAKKPKIIITGCMAGMAVRDTSGMLLRRLQKKYPSVSEFLPIEEVDFSLPQLRTDRKHALVTISNGCNNFCAYCVVPYARGKEISRPYEEIVDECRELAKRGYTHITLIGQNVNSYGSDLVKNKKNIIRGASIQPVYVKHLGKMRIPTLFPFLLDEIANIPGLTKIDFLSSNPWDFSDALIDGIAKHENVSRIIHLPVQSGDTEILKRMNRWYTSREYLDLVKKMKKKIPNLVLTTDIIVGFPGETRKQFLHTVSLSKKVEFAKAYISMYSDRPLTVAHKIFGDPIPREEKKRRWVILDELINKTNLKNGTYPLYE